MSTAKDPTTLVSPDSWAANLKSGDMISENKTQVQHLVICKRGNFIDHCESDGFSETRVDWIEANYQFKRSGNPNSFLTGNDDLLQTSSGDKAICAGVRVGGHYRHGQCEDICVVEEVSVQRIGTNVVFSLFSASSQVKLPLSVFKNLWKPVNFVDIQDAATP